MLAPPAGCSAPPQVTPLDVCSAVTPAPTDSDEQLFTLHVCRRDAAADCGENASVWPNLRRVPTWMRSVKTLQLRSLVFLQDSP